MRGYSGWKISVEDSSWSFLREAFSDSYDSRNSIVSTKFCKKTIFAS